MPTKTIYVSNDDQKTFDRAQDLAGENLSAVIVRALSEFVSRKEATAKGMKEISILVGSKGLQTEKRFVGHQLARWRGFDETTRDWCEAGIYATRKDKLAIVLTRKGNPAFWKHDWRDPSVFMQQITDTTELIVLNNADDDSGELPTQLRATIKKAVERDETPIEYLDI